MHFAPNDMSGRVLVAAIGASLAVAGCRNASTEAPIAGAAAVPQAPAETVPHGDHNPRHGGVVLMRGDVHYEVVLDRSGRYHVFFTDAVRDELPASIATDVSLTIRRPGAPDEKIAMRIDEFGESWVGSGRTVGPTKATTVRVAFSIQHEAYWIDIPYDAPSAPAKP